MHFNNSKYESDQSLLAKLIIKLITLQICANNFDGIKKNRDTTKEDLLALKRDLLNTIATLKETITDLLRIVQLPKDYQIPQTCSKMARLNFL